MLKKFWFSAATRAEMDAADAAELGDDRHAERPGGWRRFLFQRRLMAGEYHNYPQRWNWSAVMRPLDHRIEEQARTEISRRTLVGLRFFWLDGLFASISENFYLGFVPLFALAYGASAGDIGWLTAVGNLLGAMALFPGAKVLEWLPRRKPVVLWAGAGVGRIMLLLLALLPFVGTGPRIAIGAIIVLNGLRAFASNFGNPAWTAIVADLVPAQMRGRYFGNRNLAMGLAALLVTPLAGFVIRTVNVQTGSPVIGYQWIFGLAFVFGMISTLFFARIPEPKSTTATDYAHKKGDLRRAMRQSTGFLGLVISAFIWNMALQVAGPFYNVFLVTEFDASTTTIGLVSSVSSLTALFGQRYFGPIMDRKGAVWVALVSGLVIPVLPLAWMFITAPWQVGAINVLGGFVWAGYNLAGFALLLDLTPETERPRAVALYQTAVFASAVLGPILGGYVADTVSYQAIFGISAGGRLLGMLIFIFMVARPISRKLAESRVVPA
ncbi:MAG: MFS transporter [Caldilineaceae bacterium]|nr:MFS transporter [Caldilineaceae bacterium]MBP8106587.1 MFS transporter [Caldilineaceae bacterium]MBP8121294.1 MFS transporter [Caldilineaceae bacterium]MBP9070860.1 MFS transporter [Caldilineaceae bacterium]